MNNLKDKGIKTKKEDLKVSRLLKDYVHAIKDDNVNKTSLLLSVILLNLLNNNYSDKF